MPNLQRNNTVKLQRPASDSKHQAVQATILSKREAFFVSLPLVRLLLMANVVSPREEYLYFQLRGNPELLRALIKVWRLSTVTERRAILKKYR